MRGAAGCAKQAVLRCVLVAGVGEGHAGEVGVVDDAAGRGGEKAAVVARGPAQGVERGREGLQLQLTSHLK